MKHVRFENEQIWTFLKFCMNFVAKILSSCRKSTFILEVATTSDKNPR